MKPIVLPKYLFTDSGLVALSSIPLMLCAFGLYGLLVTDVHGLSGRDHLLLLGACLVPALIVFMILIRIERSHRRRRDKRLHKKRTLRQYATSAPINNGTGTLAAKPKPAEPPESRITLFPGVTVAAGENPFRPIDDAAIDETLIRLAQAQQKLRKSS